MDYKYISRFEIKASLQRNDFAEGSFVSKASMGLDDLRSLLPQEAEIKNNPDLLYTCFNAAVVNLINLNGDGITTAGAKKLVESCKLKPMNIEHSRGDIIGVITNYGFSSFGQNKILKLDELTDDPFNLSLAAIVWKLGNRAFAEYIESSQDPDGDSFKEISTSWEVGFNDYKLAVGSKDLRRARIIEDKDELESFSKHLLSMGGTGFTPEGEEVYRIIGEDCRFLGCAFTTNPAAAVQGVVSVDYKSLASDMEEEDENEDPESKEDEEKEGEDQPEAKVDEDENVVDKEKEKVKASKIIFKNDAEISPKKKNRVIKYMKYKSVDELVDHLQEAAASDVREFIQSQVDLANEQFVAVRQEKETKDQELKDAIANLKTFEGETVELKSQIAELRASLQKQQDEANFSERMDSLKEQFDLDSAASKSISKRIFGLSDEAFAEWLEDMKPLLKEKSSKEPSELEVKASAINSLVPNAQGEGKEKKTENWKTALSKIKVTVK
jgi:hypothetical protein